MTSQSAPPDSSPDYKTLTAGLSLGILFEPQLGNGPSTALNTHYLSSYGDAIETAGFRSVRLRISMDQFTYNSTGAYPNYKLNNAFFNDLQYAVTNLLLRRANTFYVLISPTGLEDNTVNAELQMSNYWGQIANYFSNTTHRLVFNLMNEPNINSTEFTNMARIESMYRATTSAIRPSNPTRYLVYYQVHDEYMSGATKIVNTPYSECGPGETDFTHLAIPTNAGPYRIYDFHVLGNEDPSGEDKRQAKIRQAWEFREKYKYPVWSGAWNYGAWDTSWSTGAVARVTQMLKNANIPGTYLMFNSSQTSIYDPADSDRDNDGIFNEWIQPDYPPIITARNPILWDTNAVYWTNSFHPECDTYTKANLPGDVTGEVSTLVVKNYGGGFERSSFLKFNLARQPAGAITTAILKVRTYGTNAYGDTIQVRLAANSNWDERGLCFSNAPAIGTTVYASQIVTSAETWYAFNVTAAITNNGVYTLVLTTSGNNLTEFYSRDQGNPNWLFAPDLVVITAPSITNYTLTYMAGTNGTVSGTTPQTVTRGDSGSAVTAVPNPGYHFVNWSDGSSANPRTDANVTNNVTVTANFGINTYTLIYNAGQNGAISGTSTQTVNYGASGSAVTAVANTGYHFLNWSDSSSANPRTDANVTNDVTVTANFATNAYTPPRPNVLFIAVDDLVPTLGCFGDATAQTPSIDSLASHGMAFLNHYTQWAVCGPARACLTTSLMPDETGVMGFKPIRAVLPDVITLPQHFKNQGYETAGTGKFYDPRTVGTIVDTNSSTLQDTDDLPSWSVPYVDINTGYNPVGNPAVDNTNQPDSQYIDYNILHAGMDLMDQLSTNSQPFFLAIGFKKPHLPFVAPKRFWDLYNRNSMPLAAFTSLPVNATVYNDSTLTDNAEITGYNPYATQTNLLTDTAHKLELVHGYYACVSMVDDFVGQLLAKLAATPDPVQPGKNMDKTTIVVLWGDHGFHLGDHGHWAKHTAMEQASRSPLIIYDPRNPKNSSSNKTRSPVDTMDIYPTLCELAGIPVPEQPWSDTVTSGRPLRGRSLVPILNDPMAKAHQGAVTMFSQSGQYGYAYRTDRFRLIEWIGSNGTVNGRDLYDYAVDPLETRNVADDPAYAAIVYELSRSLRAEANIRGAGRLVGSSPIATGGDAFLPWTTINHLGQSITLNWPGSGGVSYNILASSDLQSGLWGADHANFSGSSKTFSMLGNSRFFRIGFGSNSPPVFTVHTLVKPAALVGNAYSQSLATNAVDADPGDTLFFSKVSGPAWLSVASNGTLTGTPAIGDVGANYFTVQVSDASSNAAAASLQITIYNPPENTAPMFTSSPVVKSAVQDTVFLDTLATNALDPDIGQTLVYTKTSGPSWLTVSSNGKLTGTPGSGDVGTNNFGVQVTDPTEASASGTLKVVVIGAQPAITVATSLNISGSSTYGTNVAFTNITVQAGDIVVVAHANNKNTSANTITLSGLGGNTVASTNSGSSGTTSSAWVFYSSITAPGTYTLILDTSSATKSVTQVTSLFVLRHNNGGTLSVAATDGSVAGASPGVTSLNLDFAMIPAVTGAFGIAAGAMNTSTFSLNPAGWTQVQAAVSKRITWSNPAVSGSSASVPFGATTATDMVLAGIIVKISP